MKWQPVAKMRQALRYWLLRRLPTCEQLLPVMSRQLDQKLSIRERIVLNLHLFVCKWCLDYAKQLSFLRETVRTETKNIDAQETAGAGLSEEAKERMKRALTSR